MSRFEGTKYFFKGLARSWTSSFAFIGVVLFVAAGLLGQFLIDPLRDIKVDSTKIFSPPSLEHLLGTDHMGRDIFKQVILGSRDVLFSGLVTASIAISIGAVIGLLAGYAGGYIDGVLMTLTDIILLTPSFPLILILTSIFGKLDPVTVTATASLTMWPGFARGLRARIIQVKGEAFVEALWGLGFSRLRILFREVLPLVAPYIAIEYIRLFRGAIFVVVGISFLGLMPWSPYNWGTMLNVAYFQARSLFIPSGFWHWFSPLAAIIMTEWSFTQFARYLEETWIPRLKAYE
ncbi:ABC transporter permease [Infirmifilum sp.]|jgi:peptide/nickel transport system permease protein|uniref:ABC transporter permease n=1 Tax=Infirmifilum sp. TaxID=2856575 RepID=UPI0023563171